MSRSKRKRKQARGANTASDVDPTLSGRQVVVVARYADYWIDVPSKVNCVHLETIHRNYHIKYLALLPQHLLLKSR